MILNLYIIFVVIHFAKAQSGYYIPNYDKPTYNCTIPRVIQVNFKEILYCILILYRRLDFSREITTLYYYLCFDLCQLTSFSIIKEFVVKLR